MFVVGLASGIKPESTQDITVIASSLHARFGAAEVVAAAEKGEPASISDAYFGAARVESADTRVLGLHGLAVALADGLAHVAADLDAGDLTATEVGVLLDGVVAACQATLEGVAA